MKTNGSKETYYFHSTTTPIGGASVHARCQSICSSDWGKKITYISVLNTLSIFLYSENTLLKLILRFSQKRFFTQNSNLCHRQPASKFVRLS